MSLPDNVFTDNRLFDPLQRAFLTWATLDAPVLIYMVKASIAAVLALVISLVLDMSDPRTAVFTTFLVMQPQSGLVFSKSYYRVLGTIAGVIVSVVLVGFFAQQRELFIALFALWIGIATAAGFKFRNFQAYGFVLAGYTLCIVALPVIDRPEEVFDVAVARFWEVLIGILSATFVSDTIFPRKLSNSLLTTERERFLNIIDTILDEEALFFNKNTSDTNVAKFSSGVIGLNAVRTNSSFESGYDQKTRQNANRLNQEYMNLSTTFHSLKNIITTMDAEKDRELLEILQKSHAIIARTLKKYHTTLFLEELNSLISELLRTKSELKSFLEQARCRQKDIIDADAYNRFVSISSLMTRLLRELYLYALIYLSFMKHKDSKKHKKELSRIIRFETHTDNMLVAVAALRGSGVLLVTMIFWIFTGWHYATLSVTLSVVIGLLLGTLPTPLIAVYNFFKGGVAAVVVAGVYDFYIIPKYANDIVTLALVLVPVFALVAWLTTQPKWSGISLGFVFLFMYQCTLDPYYRVDTGVFLESTLAYMIGILFAGGAYLLVNFWSCSLMQKRVARVLRKQIIEACEERVEMQRSALENTGRDLVQQFSTQGRLNIRSSRVVYEWLLSTLEIARAIIVIRKNMKKIEYGYRSFKIAGALKSIAVYFKNPLESNEKKLMTSIQEALSVLDQKRISSEQRYQKRYLAIADELVLIRTIFIYKIKLPIVKEDTCH
ncbi:FUSC family protein [Sulfurimonas sp. HSL3-2]|uniref:FUSC family protein n=1 Tax=Hydrocurvibacter mobilis TaxID=3131936 RepID=UPI0031F740A8